MIEHIYVEKDIDRDEPLKLLLALKEVNTEVLNKVLCEAMWEASFDWKNDKVSKESKELFQKMLQKFIEQDIVTLEMIQDIIEEDTLIDLGILSKDSYINNRNKIRTKMVYELKKFNLLREECEGYSRLITELMQPNINENNVDTVIENVFSLIGFFRIDPNRAIDIILDCYSNQPHNTSFTKIMNQFLES